LRFSDLILMAQGVRAPFFGLGFRVVGSGSRVMGFWLWVWGLGFGVYLDCLCQRIIAWVLGLEFRVWDLGFGVYLDCLCQRIIAWVEVVREGAVDDAPIHLQGLGCRV
jgi:hypothetical protein